MAWTAVQWQRRRANILVITSALLLALLGFAALALDVGRLVGAKRELRTSVDNCALSAGHYIANRGLQFLPEDRAAIASNAIEYGRSFISFNDVEGIDLTADLIETGLLEWQGGRVIGFTPNLTDYDAVKVSVKMSPATKSELPAILGQLFGRPFYQPAAETIVVLDVEWGHLLPFSYYELHWDEEISPGQDNWWWDDVNHVAVHEAGVDGLPEIVLYPSKNKDAPACAGNFGALDFESCGGGNQCFIHFIENGVGPEEYGGTIATHPQISGNPGVSMGSGVVAELEALRGEVVGVFVHNPCTDGGTNGQYHVRDIRYAVLLAIYDDPDSLGNHAIVIQPNGVTSVPGWITVKGFGT